jgi:calcium/proton exchanger cax
VPSPWKKLDLLVVALPVAVVADLLALRGHVEIVKASVVGSLVGNLLLLLGVSIVISSYDRVEITFNRTSRVQSTMLFVTVGIFLIPTVFSFRGESTSTNVNEISDVIAVVLIVLYGLGLLFMMRTHRSLFRSGPEAGEPPPGQEPAPAAEPRASGHGDAAAHEGWSPRRAAVVLGGGATVLVTVAADPRVDRRDQRQLVRPRLRRLGARRADRQHGAHPPARRRPEDQLVRGCRAAGVYAAFAVASFFVVL